MKKYQKHEVRHSILNQSGLIMSMVFGVVMLLASCGSPSHNTKAADEEVTRAEQGLKTAQMNYAEEVELFRAEVNKKIAKNKKEIADINVKIAASGDDAKAKYKTQIAELEEKNEALNKRMRAYKSDARKDWEAFKSEFNKDMDNLWEALTNFTAESK